jgi:hypothetical protein
MKRHADTLREVAAERPYPVQRTRDILRPLPYCTRTREPPGCCQNAPEPAQVLATTLNFRTTLCYLFHGTDRVETRQW